MVRYLRVSDRFGPVSPVRRIDPFRENEPADREWVRMLFDMPHTDRRSTAYAAMVPGMSTAPLYNEAGKIRDLNVLEVGIKMDVIT